MQLFSRSPIYFFAAILIIMQSQCTDEDEFASREFPSVNTLEETIVDASGAVVSGDIVQLGPDPIIDHGFVYLNANSGSVLEIGTSSQVSLGPTSSKGVFTGKLELGLDFGQQYKFRAYVQTTTTTVYGQRQLFESQSSSEITLNDFNPKQGVIGDTILITGNPMSVLGSETSVLLGTVEGDIIFLNSDSIRAVIPEDVPSGNLPVIVTVGEQSATFDDPLTILTPSITDFTPQNVTFGDTLRITGANFSANPDQNRLEILGVETTPVNDETRDLLVTVIPQNITESSGLIRLIVGSQQVSSSSQLQLRNGQISSFTPLSGTPSTLVRLSGIDFSEDPSQNTVTIGGLEAEIIVSSANDITVVVPADLDPGVYTFAISVLGLPANPASATFEVLPE